MAKILPPYIDEKCKSTAEKMLFAIFKNGSFAKDWIVLHSLNLSQHTTRLYGEIDFLLLIPHGGIYVMEVKGGAVKCVNGVWQFTDKFNNTHTSNVGPFNQARDAMFSLRSAIENEYGRGHRFTKILMGFFSAFPHIIFDKHSVEYEQWQIFDKSSIDSGCENYFARLVSNFIEKHKSQKWFSEKISLPDKTELETLCGFLRGDFERIRPIKDKLEEFDRQVKSYTAEQYRVLDHISMNERCITQGGAGTGKTMIAMESAIRAAHDGKQVFLTCFNRLISEWMKSVLYDFRDNITVSGLHSFLFEESKGFDYDKTKQGNQDYFTKYLPLLLMEFYKKGISKKFDKLIIDEGQDLIREEYLMLFDSMLNGGLANGNWEIYGDFEQQAIYSQLSKEGMFNLLQKYARPAKFFLQINCRNTKQIGEETSLISGFIKPPYLLEYLEGIPVEYYFYKNSSHESELLKSQLRCLSDAKLPLNEIIIISAQKIQQSVAASIFDQVIQEIKHASEISRDQSYIGFATIQAFKGMESNYVLITDIDDLASPMAKSLLYVGMSRAKYGLILFIADSIKNQYTGLLKLQVK